MQQTTKSIIEKTEVPFKGYPLALLSLHVTHWLLDQIKEGNIDGRLYTLHDNRDSRATGSGYDWIAQLYNESTAHGRNARIPERIESALPESMDMLNRLHASMIVSFDSVWEQGKKKISKKRGKLQAYKVKMDCRSTSKHG